VSPDGVLDRAADRCLALAGELVVLAARARDVALLVAGARPDERGQAWAERAGLVHRALRREAVAAADLGHALRRSAQAAEETDPLVAGSLVGIAAGLQAGRMRLGGVEARRADDETGVRIAQLPDPPG
jgi:hypothetical protein